MFGFLRRLCSLLLQLLLRLTGSFKKAPVKGGSSVPAEDDWSSSGWKEGGEEWEPFTVKVVPNDNIVSPKEDTVPPQQQQQQQQQQQTESDLFSDMQPVFRKPPMIRVARKEERKDNDHIDLKKFSVQESTFEEVSDGGLGVWRDDVGGGWEEGVGQDEGDLVKDSQEVLKKKRLREREQRKIQQEKIRAQLKSVAQSHGGLGTKVT